MWITEDEAVVMFARYCRARFGKSAIRQVRSKAAALEKRGDTKGHDVWNKVANEIEKKSKPRSKLSAS
jgi:hypothetical protein